MQAVVDRYCGVVGSSSVMMNDHDSRSTSTNSILETQFLAHSAAAVDMLCLTCLPRNLSSSSTTQTNNSNSASKNTSTGKNKNDHQQSDDRQLYTHPTKDTPCWMTTTTSSGINGGVGAGAGGFGDERFADDGDDNDSNDNDSRRILPCPTGATTATAATTATTATTAELATSTYANAASPIEVVATASLLTKSSSSSSTTRRCSAATTTTKNQHRHHRGSGSSRSSPLSSVMTMTASPPTKTKSLSKHHQQQHRQQQQRQRQQHPPHHRGGGYDREHDDDRATAASAASAAPARVILLEEKECPICCGVMSVADQMYVMHCSSPVCNFNFCDSCLRGMCLAEQDDYQLASDGSHQVKVSVQCPMCRSKYCSAKYSTHQIITAVLQMRTAYTLEATVCYPADQLRDSMSAEWLARQRAFVKTARLVDLQRAHKRLQYYCREVGKGSGAAAGGGQFIPPPLDWTVWAHVLDDDRSVITSSTSFSTANSSSLHSLTGLKTIGTASTAASSGGGSGNGGNGNGNSTDASSAAGGATNTTTTHQNHPNLLRGGGGGCVGGGGGDGKQKQHSKYNKSSSSRRRTPKLMSDPTLLQGLEDFVTPTEQEFITELMLSGQPYRLAQAAHILHSVFMQGGGGCGPTQPAVVKHPASCCYSISSRRAVHDTYRLKRRFPLPVHMPRCVRWPVYDPRYPSAAENAGVALKFQSRKLISTTAATGNRVNGVGGGSAASVRATAAAAEAASTSLGHTTMAIASIRGLAGQVGLRRGDVVTHVQGKRVYTVEAFRKAMYKAYQQRQAAIENRRQEEQQQQQQQQQVDGHSSIHTYYSTGTSTATTSCSSNQERIDSVLIVVNANDVTAKALRRRAEEMQKEGFLDMAAAAAAFV